MTLPWRLETFTPEFSPETEARVLEELDEFQAQEKEMNRRAIYRHLALMRMQRVGWLKRAWRGIWSKLSSAKR